MELAITLGIGGWLVLLAGALLFGVIAQFIGDVRTGYEWLADFAGAAIGAVIASEFIISARTFEPVWDGLAIVPRSSAASSSASIVEIGHPLPDRRPLHRCSADDHLNDPEVVTSGPPASAGGPLGFPASHTVAMPTTRPRPTARRSTPTRSPRGGVAARLEVDPATGLDAPEAARRAAEWGTNELEPAEAPAIWKMVLDAATEPFVLLLAAAGIGAVAAQRGPRRPARPRRPGADRRRGRHHGVPRRAGARGAARRSAPRRAGPA